MAAAVRQAVSVRLPPYRAALWRERGQEIARRSRLLQFGLALDAVVAIFWTAIAMIRSYRRTVRITVTLYLTPERAPGSPSILGIKERWSPYLPYLRRGLPPVTAVAAPQPR